MGAIERLAAHALLLLAIPTYATSSSPSCSGSPVAGRWERDSLFDFLFRPEEEESHVAFEHWRYLPEPGTCGLHWDRVPSYLDVLRRRDVVFIGDSLTRNLLNAVMDVVHPRSCATATSKATVPLVRGRIPQTKTAYERCRKTRANDHTDGTLRIDSHDIRLQFVWNPWMQPFSGEAKSSTECEAELNAAGATSDDDLYYKVQVHRPCGTTAGMLARYMQGSSDATERLPPLAVLSYTVKSAQEESHDAYVHGELPRILAEYGPRVVWTNHVPKDRSTALANAMRAKGVRVVDYSPVVPPELMYDEWHVAGPVQALGAITLLDALADLAAASGGADVAT